MMWRLIVNLYLNHNSVMGRFWGAWGGFPGDLISILLHICTIVETWRSVHYLASMTLRFRRFCIIFSGICHFPFHKFVISRPSIGSITVLTSFEGSAFQNDQYWITAASIDFSYGSRTSAHTLVMYLPCKQIYRTNIHHDSFIIRLTTCHTLQLKVVFLVERVIDWREKLPMSLTTEHSLWSHIVIEMNTDTTFCIHL